MSWDGLGSWLRLDRFGYKHEMKVEFFDLAKGGTGTSVLPCWPMKSSKLGCNLATQRP